MPTTQCLQGLVQCSGHAVVVAICKGARCKNQVCNEQFQQWKVVCFRLHSHSSAERERKRGRQGEQLGTPIPLKGPVCVCVCECVLVPPACHKSMRPLAPIQEMAIHAGRLVSCNWPKLDATHREGRPSPGRDSWHISDPEGVLRSHAFLDNNWHRPIALILALWTVSNLAGGFRKSKVRLCGIGLCPNYVVDVLCVTNYVCRICLPASGAISAKAEACSINVPRASSAVQLRRQQSKASLPCSPIVLRSPIAKHVQCHASECNITYDRH